MDNLRRRIVSVADFPRPGVQFYDITPALADAAVLRQIIGHFVDRYASQRISQIVAIESRGFIFGGAVAAALGCGLVLARKPGKLPRPTFQAPYTLEYGRDTLHIHRDALRKNDRVVILDDVIATGGTACAAATLVRKSGASLLEMAVLIELVPLGGCRALGDTALHAMLKY